MKAIRTAIAALMLLGLLSAAAIPKNAKNNTNVVLAGGGPAPLCYPTPQNPCPPVIPNGN